MVRFQCRGASACLHSGRSISTSSMEPLSPALMNPNSKLKSTLSAWNKIILTYIKDANHKAALQSFRQMKSDQVRPDRFTLTILLNGCLSPRDLAEGKLIHGMIIFCRFQNDVVLETALVNMYNKCGKIKDAQRIFKGMANRDGRAWNTMISACVQHGLGKEAFHLFHEMQFEGLEPDKFTFSLVVSACSNLASVAAVKLIHASILNFRLEAHTVVGTSLITVYGDHNQFEEACSIFGKLCHRNVVSYTAMIAAYSQQGNFTNVMKLFQKMKAEGLKADKFTFVCMLDACCCIWEGILVHACIMDHKLHVDVLLGTALVSMYGKFGSLDCARLVFDKMSTRDSVAWSAMITAHAEHENAKEAMEVYKDMQQAREKPTIVTFLSVLDACAYLAALTEGRKLHDQIIDHQLEVELNIGTSLINMYSKCGHLGDAYKVFSKMPHLDLVSWNTMLAGYSHHGHGRDALQLFHNMSKEGMKPNDITFSSILSACSHAGLMHEGCHHFVSMNTCNMFHNTTLSEDHYGCVIDLLGRAGQLDEADNLINEMPFIPETVIWTTLLGACRNKGDVERGERAAFRLLELDPQNIAAYVSLSSIYAQAKLLDKKLGLDRRIRNIWAKESWKLLDLNEGSIVHLCFP